MLYYQYADYMHSRAEGARKILRVDFGFSRVKTPLRVNTPPCPEVRFGQGGVLTLEIPLIIKKQNYTQCIQFCSF